MILPQKQGHEDATSGETLTDSHRETQSKGGLAPGLAMTPCATLVDYEANGPSRSATSSEEATANSAQKGESVMPVSVPSHATRGDIRNTDDGQLTHLASENLKRAYSYVVFALAEILRAMLHLVQFTAAQLFGRPANALESIGLAVGVFPDCHFNITHAPLSRSFVSREQDVETRTLDCAANIEHGNNCPAVISIETDHRAEREELRVGSDEEAAVCGDSVPACGDAVGAPATTPCIGAVSSDSHVESSGNSDWTPIELADDTVVQSSAAEIEVESSSVPRRRRGVGRVRSGKGARRKAKGANSKCVPPPAAAAATDLPLIVSCVGHSTALPSGLLLRIEFWGGTACTATCRNADRDKPTSDTHCGKHGDGSSAQPIQLTIRCISECGDGEADSHDSIKVGSPADKSSLDDAFQIQPAHDCVKRSADSETTEQESIELEGKKRAPTCATVTYGTVCIARDAMGRFVEIPNALARSTPSKGDLAVDQPTPGDWVLRIEISFRNPDDDGGTRGGPDHSPTLLVCEECGQSIDRLHKKHTKTTRKSADQSAQPEEKTRDETGDETRDETARDGK